MSRYLAGLLTAALAGMAIDQEAAKPPDLGKVRKAIAAGREYLIEEQIQAQTPAGAAGHWEADINAKGRPGGWSALAMLALLHSGEKVDAPVIVRGLRYLRTIEPADT